MNNLAQFHISCPHFIFRLIFIGFKKLERNHGNSLTIESWRRNEKEKNYENSHTKMSSIPAATISPSFFLVAFFQFFLSTRSTCSLTWKSMSFSSLFLILRFRFIHWSIKWQLNQRNCVLITIFSCWNFRKNEFLMFSLRRTHWENEIATNERLNAVQIYGNKLTRLTAAQMKKFFPWVGWAKLTFSKNEVFFLWFLDFKAATAIHRIVDILLSFFDKKKNIESIDLSSFTLDSTRTWIVSRNLTFIFQLYFAAKFDAFQRIR